MSKKLILHYAQKGGDIPSYEFDTIDEMLGYSLAEASYEKVYLVSVFDEVFVSCNLGSSLNFIKWNLKEYIPIIREEVDSIDIFYQEYDSYEEAYQVALDMQEISPLCYTK
jgi:hypothetical protein